jgi:6-phosphogluconolactonase
MKVWILGIFALTLIAACGGGGGNGGPPPTPSRFLYAYATVGGPNSFPSAIYSFAVYSDGTLNALGSAISIGPGGPAALAISRDSKALYSTNSNLDLLAFQISGDGSLTAAAVPQYEVGAIMGLATSPTTDFLYASVALPGLIVYSADTTSAALSQTSTTSLGTVTFQDGAVITPDGAYLYQSYAPYYGSMTLQLAGFSINATTGALTPVPGSPIDSAVTIANTNVMAIDPTGKFLYAGYQLPLDSEGGGMAAYSIDAGSGALTAVPGSPFPIAGIPNGAAVDASGKFLIVSLFLPGGQNTGNCLAVLSIDSGTGALTAVSGSPFGPLQTCASLAADPSQEYVYAGSTSTISVLSIDQTSGALTPVGETALAANYVPGLALTH